MVRHSQSWHQPTGQKILIQPGIGLDHLIPAKAGLIQGVEEWPWSSVQEHSETPQEKATRHPILPIGRVLLASGQRARV